MRRVPDAQEALAIPSAQPVHPDGQKLDIVPARDLPHPIVQIGHELDDRCTESIEPLRAYCLCAPLWNEKGALPIVSPIEHDHHLAGADSPERLSLVGLAPRQFEPQDVDRRAQILYFQSGTLANDGMASIGGYDQRTADRERARTRSRAHPDDAASFFDQIDSLGLHA